MTVHGDLIRTTRIRKQLSQAKLAEKIGNKASYISRIETGDQRGSEETLFRIAKVLGISPQLLFDTAGIKIRFIPGKRESLDGHTYEFASLSPEVKKTLLEIAPILENAIKANSVKV